MNQNSRNSISISRKENGKDYWDLIISLRLYVITLFLLLPIIILSIQLVYIQPVNLIILGFSVLLIIRFVLFEPRIYSMRYQKISLILLIPCVCAIFFNFLLGLIIHIIHLNFIGIIDPLIISIVSFVYYIFMVPKKRFKKINERLISWRSKWVCRAKNTILRRHIISFGVLLWLLISTLLIFIPRPIYIQKGPSSIKEQKIGIWSSFKSDIPNETMQKIADANIYFITTVNEKNLGPSLEDWLNKCKSFDIDVHISLSVEANGVYKFVNIWTIEDLMKDIETILEWFDENNFLGDPITTAVYDMEGLIDLNFIEYLLHDESRAKLSEYYKLQDIFITFNNHLREDYNLNVQICGDFSQGFDQKDLDNDIASFYGLLSDVDASRSYMIYRKDLYDLNYVLDSCRLFNKGDTLIINSWKFKGCKCWENINCMIEEARLVLGYPEKEYNLEIWDMNNFLESYGIDGLYDFIEEITKDPLDWPVIYVWYRFPSSEYIDLVFYFYALLDLYSPILKFSFQKY